MLRFLVILLLFPFFSFGQNLIPNGDFELGPPVSTWAWEYADSICGYADTLGGPLFWTVASPSPDRILEGGTFLCGHDEDTAAHGSFYVQFAGGGIPTQWNEIGKTTLIAPLAGGSLYYLSYFAHLETWGNYADFSSVSVSFAFNNGDTITSPLITDTMQWFRFDTSFIASANATELELLCVTDSYCGFKIDSITLRQVGENSVTQLSEAKNITIHPNPSTGIFTVQGTAAAIQVYGLFGRLVLRTNKREIDMSNYPSGIYLVRAGEAVRKLILR